MIHLLLTLKKIRNCFCVCAQNQPRKLIKLNSFSHAVTASFAETIKSAEPLSSVFLGYFYFNEGNTLSTYLTLLPICMGVSISCMHDGSFGLLGFLCAATSNLCFSSRAVLTKHLFRVQKESITMDEVCLFTHISQIGLVVLIPLTMIMEGKQILEFVKDENANSQLWELAFLLGVNGVFYSIYNLTSFLVLSRTDLISHAVLNVFRRVVIIVFTSYYFSIVLLPLNVIGIAIAVFGVLLFCYSRSREMKSKIALTK
jgi:solute carrier family 35, member E1